MQGKCFLCFRPVVQKFLLHSPWFLCYGRQWVTCHRLFLILNTSAVIPVNHLFPKLKACLITRCRDNPVTQSPLLSVAQLTVSIWNGMASTDCRIWNVSSQKFIKKHSILLLSMLHFLTRCLPLCLPQVDITQRWGGFFSNSSSAGVFYLFAHAGQRLQYHKIVVLTKSLLLFQALNLLPKCHNCLSEVTKLDSLSSKFSMFDL